MRRRILLITPFAPAHPARHGSVHAVHGLACALAERHDLVLLHLDREQDVEPRLAARCLAVHAFAAPSGGRWRRRERGAAGLLRARSLWASELGVGPLRRRVCELCERLQPEVVQVEHGIVGEALAGAPPGAARIVTIYDPAAHRRESLPFRRRGRALLHRADARAAVREERRALALADAAVVFTERDRHTLMATAGDTEVVTIPLGWDVPARPLDPVGAGPPTLVFVASFRHPPNVDAALTLARRILPAVRAARPDARLEIVGESPPSELLALSGDGVRVTGTVPSVTPYLDRAAVVVVPIAIGGGMRVKVLEALAAGKAVVASPRAAEGLTARAGEDLLVADGDVAIAAAVVGLLGDERRRRHVAGRARAWALRELAWPAAAARYEELYARVERRRGLRPREAPAGRERR